MRQHLHRFQWFYFTFLAIIFVGLSLYYVVRIGYYPVVVVNGNLILARDFSDEYAAAYYYYARSADPKEVDVRSNNFQKELRRAVMQELIEKSLVHAGLESKIGDQAEALVSGKIGEQNLDPQKLEEAARLLYGMTAKDLLRLVLVPRAEREILEADLISENKKIDQWLSSAGKTAKVFIITPEFYWEQGVVKSRD